ncbi:30S ribosomal protein S5 [Thermodesulfobacterium sp. TA1]|uniref:30S ribosomal protein S5 n=1 Tax=Thermodesulfobacterium sp. TA1 TaxID=2234087 RepID=UPI001232DB60|nr:30S ribosomal protein S5 [Thermodesulfobacterium sp. TA1]QER41478.1 30S ribosomal protein S5 [Thermodesulfobacterium sp. TA1]
MVRGTEEFVEKIIQISRVTKVTKGGKKLRFSALVIVGDGKGRVGYGLGKAPEVPDAIRKAIEKAKKSLINVPIIGGTIPHSIVTKFGASTILLKPAKPGTGVIAGGTVRAIMDAVGITDVVTKCIGSSNPHNLVKATFRALSQLQSLDYVAKKRGKTFEDLKREMRV